ncbi:hypothetical protein V2I29_01060 [Campylobacter sp. CX2-8023-23]|uniref:hypothetical protein n=1 Tax=Campylobacter porcelli TaxID=1660073 RepID=UPI002E9B6306|nr:hypothetical protein [Campylobacter sp. CX2-8023-23]
MRGGFSLILAIVFILAISSIALNIITINSTTISMTNQLYLHSQAKLIAISSTQNAIANIQRNDFDKSCPSQFTLYYPNSGDYMLKSVVTIKYIGGKMPKSCNAQIWKESKDGSGIKAAIMHTLVNSNPNLLITPVNISKITTQKP